MIVVGTGFGSCFYLHKYLQHARSRCARPGAGTRREPQHGMASGQAAEFRDRPHRDVRQPRDAGKGMAVHRRLRRRFELLVGVYTAHDAERFPAEERVRRRARLAGLLRRVGILVPGSGGDHGDFRFRPRHALFPLQALSPAAAPIHRPGSVARKRRTPTAGFRNRRRGPGSPPRHGRPVPPTASAIFARSAPNSPWPTVWAICTSDHRVTLLLQAEALAIETAGGIATGVVYRRDGAEQTARGDLVVLGANAIFNPFILTKSGIDHPCSAVDRCTNRPRSTLRCISMAWKISRAARRSPGTAICCMTARTGRAIAPA